MSDRCNMLPCRGARDSFFSQADINLVARPKRNPSMERTEPLAHVRRTSPHHHHAGQPESSTAGTLTDTRHGLVIYMYSSIRSWFKFLVVYTRTNTHEEHGWPKKPTAFLPRAATQISASGNLQSPSTLGALALTLLAMGTTNVSQW
jgi:hypothetical protein